MRENWIGPEDNTSGAYVPTVCDELKRRNGGVISNSNLYLFRSRFGQEYYITDPKVIKQIEERLIKEKAGEITDIYAYLYQLVIDKYGMNIFLHNIGQHTAHECDKSYKSGKLVSINDIRETLGLPHLFNLE